MLVLATLRFRLKSCGGTRHGARNAYCLVSGAVTRLAALNAPPMNITAPHAGTTTTAEPKPTKTRAPRVARGRGRLETENRGRVQRPRRTAHERHEQRVDLDGMYLTEMAASTVLGTEQETELARNIANAEKAILDALSRAPAGIHALLRLGTEVASGSVDIRDVLLNPDQDGLDLVAVRERVQNVLATADTQDDAARGSLVDSLADIRLDGEIIEGVVGAIRAAAELEGDGPDAAALGAIERARRDLKRNKERFVVGNLRLVVLFARKYLNRGVPLLDLIQEGNLGLMRAADKFDHRRGFRFSTYAAWWIKQALQRALLDRTLRLPVHVADDRRRVGKVRAAFQAQHLREPTADEISNLSGLARERVLNILSLPAQPASLDTPMGEDGDASLGDIVASPVAPPDHTVAQRALSFQLAGMLDALTPREQQVVKMRFGIGGTREHTLEEVGRALSLTRERIRQIERAALDKLRARSERVQLRSYLDT